MAIMVLLQFLAVELHNILHQVLHQCAVRHHRVELHRITALRRMLRLHGRIQVRQVLHKADHRVQPQVTVLRATAHQVTALRLHAQHPRTARRARPLEARLRERAHPRVQLRLVKDRDFK
jgi:hypothetical protein